MHLLIYIEHPDVHGVCLGVDLRTDTNKHRVFKRDRITCSKFVNRFAFNSQDNWGASLVV